MRHYNNVSGPVYVPDLMKEASWVISNQRFPDILQEGFIFSSEVIMPFRKQTKQRFAVQPGAKLTGSVMHVV